MAIIAEIIDFSTLNEIKDGDGVNVENINAPLKASAYAQAIATTQPDITDIGGDGEPNIEIIEQNGSPKFKFSNIKGKTGAKLISQILIGQDENGGNIYQQTFNDGTTATFTAPRGEQGEKGDKGEKGDTPKSLYINGVEYRIRTSYDVADKGVSGYVTFVLEV